MRSMKVITTLLLGASVAMSAALSAAQTGSSGSTALRITKHIVNVRDLDATVAFFREVLGAPLADPTRGVRAAAPAAGLVQQLTGAPDGVTFREIYLNIPGATDRFRFEMTEFKGAPQSAAPRFHDPGATFLIAPVANVEGALRAAVGAGATVVTVGGAPVGGPQPESRGVIVRDANGYFVNLVGGGAATSAAFGFVVADVAKAAAFYRDRLGMEVSLLPDDRAPVSLAQAGLRTGTLRAAALKVPGNELSIYLLEFRDVERKDYRRAMQEPATPAFAIDVTNLEAAVDAFVAGGGEVISKTTATPARRIVFVRDLSGIVVEVDQARQP